MEQNSQKYVKERKIFIYKFNKNCINYIKIEQKQ